MSQLVNAIKMVELLSIRNVVSLQELSDTLEISVRAVQRLKDHLLDTGFNIQTVMGPSGGYVLESRLNQFNLDFSHEELKLIRQGLKYLVESHMVNPSPAFPLAISKLANQIDDYGIETVSSFQTVRLNVDPVLYQKHISMLELAISRDQRITLHYRKNHKEINTYRFEPYEMVIVNKFWYVMGFDEKNRYLSLKINRIESIELLESTFRRDASVKESSLSQFGYRIKPVKLTVKVTDADYISEYIWGKDQIISWLDDGSFLLEVEFQNENAAKDFILSNGSKIHLLKPASLRHWLKEELEKILVQYP